MVRRNGPLTGEHLLDCLARDCELARDIGLGETLFDQAPNQIATPCCQSPCLAGVLESFGADPSEAIEGLPV
jgi:hypothetical protein